MKKLLLIAAIAGAGIGTWRWRQARGEQPSDASLVTDRLWVDHLPRNERDTIQVFAALTQEPIGIFQKVSAWQGSYELFRYEGHDGELRLVFPQNGDKEKVRAKARRCDEAGMDFCLELSGSSRGAKRYYSVEGWEIGSVADEDARIHDLLRVAPHD
jgi:hypothetical protein